MTAINFRYRIRVFYFNCLICGMPLEPARREAGIHTSCPIPDNEIIPEAKPIISLSSEIMTPPKKRKYRKNPRLGRKRILELYEKMKAERENKAPPE